MIILKIKDVSRSGGTLKCVPLDYILYAEKFETISSEKKDPAKKVVEISLFLNGHRINLVYRGTYSSGVGSELLWENELNGDSIYETITQLMERNRPENTKSIEVK